MTAPGIVLLAHGSPDRRHRDGVERLARRVHAAVPSRAVHTAYLDHHGPSPQEAARRSPGGASVVPVLVTPAHHARVDVPAAVAAMWEETGGAFTATAPLGPDPLLLQGVGELLARAGISPSRDAAVVLYAAGSSDGAAAASVRRLLDHQPDARWGAREVAALDGGRDVAEVAASLGERRILAVSFMVADGVLRDRMARRCADAGIDLVPGTLGDTVALAELAAQRAGSLAA